MSKLATAAVAALVALGCTACAGTAQHAGGNGSASTPGAGPRASQPVAAAVRAPADPRAPRERLNARDTALARQALARPAELLPAARWRELPAAPDGPRKPCRGVHPDLSRFTVTGKARSSFRAGHVARIDGSVRVYANAGQASLVFQATAIPKALRCIGAGMLRDLRARGRSHGVRVRVAAERVYPKALLAPEGAAYQIVYALIAGGRTDPLTLDVLVFRSGRAIAALSFVAVYTKREEVAVARLVADRLSRS